MILLCKTPFFYNQKYLINLFTYLFYLFIVVFFSFYFFSIYEFFKQKLTPNYTFKYSIFQQTSFTMACACALCAMTDPSELFLDDDTGFWLCGDCEKHWQDFGDNDFVVFPGEVEEKMANAAKWLELMRECQADRISIIGELDYNPEAYDEVFA